MKKMKSSQKLKFNHKNECRGDFQTKGNFSNGRSKDWPFHFTEEYADI